MGKESGLRQALLFVALFLGYFLFSFSYFLYCLQRLLKGIGHTHLNPPRPPVLTPMSGSRGVVTLLAHISPACSTQPSISNVPPAQADNNFGHYKYPASTLHLTTGCPKHRNGKGQAKTVMVLMVPF